MIEIIDITPDNNLEKKYFEDICEELRITLDKDWSFIFQNYGDPTPNSTHRKIIVMNAGENHKIPKQVNDDSVEMIFKQYIPLKVNSPSGFENDYHPKVRSIPLGDKAGFFYKEKHINDRTHDYAFVGQLSPSRVNFANYVNSIHNESSVIEWYRGFDNGQSVEKYSELMSDTKIALCPEGTSSPETFRYFEAMKAGCVVVTSPKPSSWFYDGAPHIETDWTNLPQIADNLLSNPSALEDYHKKSLAWWDSRISPLAVAQYIKGEIS
mgnify:CR=1 FL=1